jgi:hypothetical protein
VFPDDSPVGTPTGSAADDHRPQDNRQALPGYVTSFTWFLIGGILALLIRSELAFPGQQIVNDELYNQAAADAKTSVFDSAHPLGQELLDDAVAEQRGARLAALDRASECLRAGTYGVS